MDKEEETGAVLDIVLYCADRAVRDNVLSRGELDAVRRLKLLCSVKEGDFVRLRHEEVAQLIGRAMEVVLGDHDVSTGEAEYKVGLQELFDLSYDEFLEIVRDPMRAALTDLLEQADPEGKGLTGEQFADFQRKALRLDSVFTLDLNTPKRPQGEVPGRSIPGSVKDAVWRRDQGRCANCGSQRRLEFDHIIPYAKGGSNTYRNIQLMCETCNRAKSDSLAV